MDPDYLGVEFVIFLPDISNMNITLEQMLHIDTSGNIMGPGGTPSSLP